MTETAEAAYGLLKGTVVMVIRQDCVVIDCSLTSNSPTCLLSHSLLKPIVSKGFSSLTLFSRQNLSLHSTLFTAFLFYAHAHNPSLI